MSEKEKVYIALFEIGDFYEVADITRVFSSIEKAKRYIPKGFKELSKIGGYKYYGQDESKKQWVTIKIYEVE